MVSYNVNQRMREMGVRIALGAMGKDISQRVIGGSLRLVAIGLTAGLLGALTLGRLMRGAPCGQIQSPY